MVFDTWLPKKTTNQGNVWSDPTCTKELVLESPNNNNSLSDLADLTLRQKKENKSIAAFMSPQTHSYLEHFHGKFAHLPEMEEHVTISEAEIQR